ncbi:MAG: GAF domain-containing protein, partial [Proteobacteria bacterium]
MSENFDRNAAGLGMDYLLEVSQELSMARNLADVTAITRRAARVLCGADGATFVLKDGDYCYYVDEDAIGPLWKGRRFPQDTCVSGWSMRERQTVLIEDITIDPRVPQEAYRATFVKSLVMVPIRETDPIGAIGNYWATPHRAPAACIELLRALANLVAIALENVRLVEALQKTNRVLEDSMRARDEFLSVAS